ncbi:MAG: pyrroline-5-carboxylate reductase [Thermodesulfobacteriota bacterium]
MQKIGIIGTGNMGSALIRGLTASGKAPGDSITAFDVDEEKVRRLHDELGIVPARGIRDAAAPDVETLVLSVKPQIMDRVLGELAGHMSHGPLVMSIAAGITTDRIVAKLGPRARVIRAMPNAAAMVGQSATALCTGGAADESDLLTAMDLFSAFGAVASVDEKMMNAVTALSGSGPAYFFVMLEGLVDGAVLMGMDRPTARVLAVHTMLGAALMAGQKAAFSDLKDQITSPGGTTIAGLEVMERAGLRGVLMETIRAATTRGDELAGPK